MITAMAIVTTSMITTLTTMIITITATFMTILIAMRILPDCWRCIAPFSTKTIARRNGTAAFFRRADFWC